MKQFLDGLRLDLRAAWRAYAKNPAFAILSFFMLSAGLGGTASMYSLVNAWVLDPLPYPDSDRLMFFRATNMKNGNVTTVTPGEFQEWQRDPSFEAMAAYQQMPYNLTGVTGGVQSIAPERLTGAQVSASFFSILGVTPVLGRDFLAEEDQPGAGRCVILTHEYWETRFLADPSVIGKTIAIDDEPSVIRGVLPAHFQYPLVGPAQVFMPLALSVKDRADRKVRWLDVVARRRANVTFDQARESLAARVRSMREQYPDTNVNIGLYAKSVAAEIGEHQGNSVVIACFGLTMFVLLIVCSNIAGLVLAKSVERQKEMAVRLALGATRARVIRQLLTEQALTFVAGAMGSVFVAKGILIWISNGIPYENRAYLRNFAQISLDWRGVMFALFTALAAALIFGLGPALEGSRGGLNDVLKDGSRGSSRRGRFIRDGLIGAEIAMATILLVSNALMLESLKALWEVNPGFQAEGLLSVDIGLPPKAYQDLGRATRTLEDIGDRVRAIAGVERASLVEHIPYGHSGARTQVWIEGRPEPLPGEVPSTRISGASPGYFATMKIPMISGRDFMASDDAQAPRVAVINEIFAQRQWPNQDPLGRHIRLGPRDAALASAPVEVVGVVKSVRMFGLDDHPEMQMYVPMRQRPVQTAHLAIRANGGGARVGPAVRDAVWSIDRNIPVPEISDMPHAIEVTYTPNRMTAEMMSWFTLLALVLAATGLYAMMSWSVEQRSREIGIRMALGAGPFHVLATVLRRGTILTAIGSLLGLAGAAATTQSLTIVLYNISPRDPATFGGVSAMLILVAMAACYIPARRASQLDPSSALRHD